MRRAASPLLAAGDQLQLDHALGAEIDLHAAVAILAGRRHEHADSTSSARPSPWDCVTTSPKVRRADLLLAFADQHQVHRQLLARGLERVQRAEEGGLRPFLIDRAAADA